MNKLSKVEIMAVFVAVGVLGYVFFSNQVKAVFSSATNPIQTQVNTNNGLPTTGVQTQDTVIGTGDTAARGDKLTVHYVGVLPDGKVFDSSLDRNQPIQFVLGAGQVIRGWDDGLVGMKVGGRRILKIAPDFGYGAQAVGALPANSTLVFEVQLLNVEKPK